MTRPVEEIVADLERMNAATNLPRVKTWKAGDPHRRAIGCLPVFAPREVLWAASATLVVLVAGRPDRRAGCTSSTIRQRG